MIAASVARTELAILTLTAGDIAAAASWIRSARFVIDDSGLHGYATSALTFAVAGRVALLQGAPSTARTFFDDATALRSRLTFAVPTLAVPTRLQLARCAMGLGAADAAQQFLSETDELVRQRPDLGSLIDEVEGVRADFSSLLRSRPVLPTLSPAEARLLPFLPTHLSFRGIGEQLYVSPHTVKTQAISIYRKFGVTSRGAAIETARLLGLLNHIEGRSHSRIGTGSSAPRDAV